MDSPLIKSTETISPLLLADRLIGLAEQADRAGFGHAASRLVRLAIQLCSEKPHGIA